MKEKKAGEANFWQILYRGFLVFLPLILASCTALFAATAPEVEWEKTFGGNHNDIACCVQQTSDGGYIVAGETDSYGTGYGDFWLVKLDPHGNLEWDKTFGGANFDKAYSVQQTSDGGYIVAGITTSYGAVGGDFWLVKVDPDGNLEWEKAFGGIGDEAAWSVQQTSDDGYIAAGYTYSYGAGSADFYIN